jgi:ABC-type phosphate transport system ATPase subunit
MELKKKKVKHPKKEKLETKKSNASMHDQIKKKLKQNGCLLSGFEIHQIKLV